MGQGQISGVGSTSNTRRSMQGMFDALRQLAAASDAKAADDASDAGKSQQDPLQGVLKALQPLLQMFQQMMQAMSDSAGAGSGGGGESPSVMPAARPSPAQPAAAAGATGDAGSQSPSTPGASSAAPPSPADTSSQPPATGSETPSTTTASPTTAPAPDSSPASATASPAATPPVGGGLSSSPPVGTAGIYNTPTDSDPSATPATGSPTALNADGTFSTAAVTGQLSPDQTQAMAVNVGQRLQKDFGLTQAQAAGVVGNLDHESIGMNSDVNEIGSDPNSPNFGAPNSSQFGYGWAQWSSSRKTDLLDLSKANGMDPSSPEANYQMLKHELETTESATVPALKAATTAEDAASVFRKVFERASNPVDADRIADANQIDKWLAEAQGS